MGPLEIFSESPTVAAVGGLRGTSATSAFAQPQEHTLETQKGHSTAFTASTQEQEKSSKFHFSGMDFI